MKILYDHQAFQMQKFGGVSNCFVKLIEKLPVGVKYEIAIKETDNVHLRGSGLVDVGKMKCSPTNFISPAHFKGQGRLYNLYTRLCPEHTSFGRNKFYAIETLKKGDFDIFHPTFFDDYFLPYLNDKPYVLTVHDMIPELFFSKRDGQVRKKPWLCEKAAHIVAVSQKTKDDLIDILKIPEDKISVVYHGAPDYSCQIKSSPLIEGRYILYVGNRLGYKNFIPMIESLVPVLHNHEDIRVVCTGEEFSKKEKKIFRDVDLEKRIIHYRASDSDLQNLYAHALCFIYPSLYEGFGIPILEAYNAHCPVLLNNRSCFPEIAQNAAIYFNLDNSSSDLEDVMEQFLSMSSKDVEILKKKQLDRLQMFSWKKSAQKLSEIYMNAIEANK